MNAECPFCGQDRLLLVEVIPANLGLFVICAECERMWRTGDPLEPKLAIDYCHLMESRGLPPTWDHLRKLSEKPVLRKTMP